MVKISEIFEDLLPKLIETSKKNNLKPCDDTLIELAKTFTVTTFIEEARKR